MKSIVGGLLLVLLFADVCVQGKRVIRAPEHAEKTGRHIVKLHSETNHDRFQRTLEKALPFSEDSKVYVRSEGPFKFFELKLREDSLDKVTKLEDVEYIEEETMMYIARHQTESWALDRIDQIEAVRDTIYEPGPGRDGEGVDIYILDTGIQYERIEFGGRALYPGFDPMDDFEDTLDFDNEHQEGADCHGHGTAVASLAAGTHLGVAKKATLYSVRVLSCFGTAPRAVVLDGMNRAMEAAKNSNRRSVISMSLGGPYGNSSTEAVQAATDAGVPVVVAAGNSLADACDYSPAGAPTAITVGGTAYGDKLYYFTNGGSCVDILAPGERVLIEHLGVEHGRRLGSGTSFACPIVSGVAAIYLQERPSLSVEDLTQMLIDTALKGVVDLSRLSHNGLNETTPNILVQVKNVTCDNAILGDKCMPAQSCQEILNVKPDSKSGYYYLNNSNGRIAVYCNMEDIKGNIGMIRIANVDMKDPYAPCPKPLRKRTDPARMCQRASNDIGCSNVTFPTKGFSYKTVCGRINAIQFGATNAFRRYQLTMNREQLTVDDLYVDGVVLSRINATGDRYHVWTFAAALDEDYRPDGRHACPCTHNEAATSWSVPPFIGEDYFCETGTIDEFEYGRFYVDDPLWDGKGCGRTSTCCSRGNYFCKTFDNAVSDDIELRLCGDEMRDTEDSPITLAELYIL